MTYPPTSLDQLRAYGESCNHTMTKSPRVDASGWTAPSGSNGLYLSEPGFDTELHALGLVDDVKTEHFGHLTMLTPKGMEAYAFLLGKRPSLDWKAPNWLLKAATEQTV